MELSIEYKPEKLLLQDAYIGSPDVFLQKLEFLSKLAQQEPWSYANSPDKFGILRNYLFYTYDRLKEENKIVVTDDGTAMCFNTGLQTRHESDIYAYFVLNNHPRAKKGQKWFLYGFKQKTDHEMQCFSCVPDVADYFINPSDFIYDKKLNIEIDYDHIIDDNFDRFEMLGFKEEEKFVIRSLLVSRVKKSEEKVKRNYKLAIPQFYTDKTTGISKIQLLLPLYLRSNEKADLALVVDKNDFRYIAKTVLPLEWAYVNSRRIIKPDVDWLNALTV